MRLLGALLQNPCSPCSPFFRSARSTACAKRTSAPRNLNTRSICTPTDTTIPTRQGLASTEGNFAFVSDSVLVGAVAQRSKSWARPPTNLYAFDTSRNTVRDAPEIPVLPFLFCPISGSRVALSVPPGVSACDDRLACSIVSRTSGTLAASSLGTRLVLRTRAGGPQTIFDTGTWKTIAEVSLGWPRAIVTAGGEHFFTRAGGSAVLERDDGRSVRLKGLGFVTDVQLLDPSRIAAIVRVPLPRWPCLTRKGIRSTRLRRNLRLAFRFSGRRKGVVLRSSSEG